jgi:hypothetical protein
MELLSFLYVRIYYHKYLNMAYLTCGMNIRFVFDPLTPIITGTTMLGIHETMRQEKSKVDLVHLINKKDTTLRVITLLGEGADLGQTTSIIWTAYENEEVKISFSCRAWVRMMHPFNLEDFIQSLVEQFHTSAGIDFLLETKKKGRELADEFNGYVNGKFLIVLSDLSSMEEWNRVKRCFPNNNKGSLIIVATRQGEVASLCAGQESIVSELKQCSFDQNVYAFYKKVMLNVLPKYQ